MVSASMDKTCVVIVEWRKRHRLYKKSVKMRTRFMVHDPMNKCLAGDMVEIRETRPISKTKRWTISEIIQREELADIQPDEIILDDESVLSYQPESAESGAGDSAQAENVAVGEVLGSLEENVLPDSEVGNEDGDGQGEDSDDKE